MERGPVELVNCCSNGRGMSGTRGPRVIQTLVSHHTREDILRVNECECVFGE